MKCGCSECSAYVSEEGDLCVLCAQECFPVVDGQRTVSTTEFRKACHRERETPKPPTRPAAGRLADPPSASLAEAAKRAGTALLDESRKKLVPALVDFAREEGIRFLRGRRE